MNHMERSSGFYVAEGFVFIILGAIAISMPGFVTLSLELLLGWLFVIGGIIQGFRTFQTKDAPGFLISMISSFFLILAGVIMLNYPLTGALTLTLLLSIFFFIDGILKLVMSFQMNSDEPKGWTFFGGVLEILVALIIWSQWPISAIWFIGFVVGINMLFYGASELAYGIRLRRRKV